MQLLLKKDNTLWTMGGNYRLGLGYDSDATWYTPLTKILDNVQDSPAGWAMEEVEKAIGMQLIPKELQGNYSKAINREEFCILAVKMIEIKSGMSIEAYMDKRGVAMPTKSPFTDCNNKDVIAASALSIVNGTSPTTFDPYNVLTREQAAKVLSTTARAVGEDIAATAPPDYADLNEIGGWAQAFTGYVYNINVMKGVGGGNRFNPKGSYQRQQAYMTMYRIFNAIDNVSLDSMAKLDVDQTLKGGVFDSKSLEGIKSDVSAIIAPSNFYMEVEGFTDSSVGRTKLKYNIFYKEANVRIDTFWSDRNVSYSIYNQQDDATLTRMLLYADYEEYIKGNMLPIRLLNVAYLEQLEIDDETELFTANYDSLNGEQVLYIKSSMKNGITTQMWYSLKYLVPIQFEETWIEDGETSTISWSVTYEDIDTLEDSLFEIPDDIDLLSQSPNAEDYYGVDNGTTREQLLYEVATLDVDEIGIGGMTQIFYYSDSSYDLLVAYFNGLLFGTEGYSLSEGEEMTAIDGTLNGGDNVIVIVNNYMKYEPEVGMNGVNVNYYK